MKLNPGFRQLLLLCPPHAQIPASFNSVIYDPERYTALLHQTQRLRGAIYLEDGAIDESQITNGRHVVESDLHSWHLLVLSADGGICACTRYRHHQSGVRFGGLAVSGSSLASSSAWGKKVRSAVEEELTLSRSLDLPFVEVGGWAVSDEIRNTVEALRMVLASYAFFRTFGGAVGLATATARHSSASILRRIGGRPLEYEGQSMPAYVDPQYNCHMEMLRFYSWAPNPRFNSWIGEIGREIESTPVISGTTHDELAWMDIANPVFSGPCSAGSHSADEMRSH